MAEQTLVLLAELVALRTKWESRIVEVKNGDLTTTLFVNFGEIAAVRSSKPGEPIGRLMVRKGLISREHYIEVLERLDDVLATGQRVAFGEVAVGLGYAKAADVSSCLTDQVRALAMRVFQGDQPQWTVGPLPTDRDPSRDLVMRVESVFLEAIRPLDDARKGAMGLDAARGRALGPTWTLDEIDVRLELTEDEVRFVHEALAGDKTVDTLLHTTTHPGVDTRSILTAVLATGAAESRALTAAEQRDLPKRRKEPPPLPLWAAVDATRAKGAAETAVRAKQSLAPKPNASPLAQMLRAEQHLEHGRQAFVSGDVQGALTELERALELNPASIETQLFVGWCHHRLTKMPLTGVTRDDLERLARQGIRENPQIAIANLVLAAVEESVGRPQEAATALARARTIDCELVDGATPAGPPLVSDPPMPPALPAIPPLPAAAAPLPATAAKPVAPPAAPAPAAVAPVPAPPAAAPGAPAPVAAAARTAPPPAKGAPVGAILGGLVVLALGVGGAVFFLHPGSSPSGSSPADAGSASGAFPPPSAPVEAGTSTGSTPGVALTDAGAVKAPPIKVDAGHGVIRLPPNARGHRVFVDGHAIISEPDHVIVLCGHHEIQIGSHGATHTVDVPCGGSTDLPP